MAQITLIVDDGSLARACKYAADSDTSIETLLSQHIEELAKVSGRRMTFREQIYRDCEPNEAVIAQLRAEGSNK